MPPERPGHFAQNAVLMLILDVGFRGAYAIPAVDAADDSIIDAELAASDKRRQNDSDEGYS
jgi:hypothetical protein